MSPSSIDLKDAIKATGLPGLRPPRRLDVSMDEVPVGTLAEFGNLWNFTYAASWLIDPHRFALAPALPLQAEAIVDGGSDRPVQWYFDNLLPEEEQRRLVASDADVDGADAFALLAYYGAESAGSLTLLPPGITLGPGSLKPLPETELSQRIRQLPRTSLAAGAAKRMSLAGAQHKLAITERQGDLYEPSGAAASTHILKPDNASEHYPHSVVNEWFVMQLAQRMGLEVAQVERRYVPEPVFITARFDRQVKPDGVRRRHAIDACQLLNVPGAFKYRLGGIETLETIIQRCRRKLWTRQRLFDWLVFNVLTGNNDAHLKNLSFLVSEDGIDLAPHYDLLSTACYETRAYADADARWPASELAWPIRGTTHFHELRFDDLVVAGEAMGLPRRAAVQRLKKQLAGIEDAARLLCEQVEQENASWAAQLDVGNTLQGEMRLLRTLIHVVIADMVKQLTPA